MPQENTLSRELGAFRCVFPMAGPFTQVDMPLGGELEGELGGELGFLKASRLGFSSDPYPPIWSADDAGRILRSRPS
jgi:hypothetical protein